MTNSWKTISASASLATLLFLGVATTPRAEQLSNGAATTQTTVVTTTNTAATTTAKPATAQKKQRSVLDADVLESPFSFFKDVTTTSDEDDSDITIRPNTVVLALKALAATLLSTIM